MRKLVADQDTYLRQSDIGGRWRDHREKSTDARLSDEAIRCY